MLAGLGLGGVLAFIALLAIAIGASWIDRSNQEVLYASTSPDGAHRMVVTNTGDRLGRFFDPRVELTVRLEATASATMVDYLYVGVERKSGVGRLAATWAADTVVVTGLEQRHEMRATLQRSRQRDP